MLHIVRTATLATLVLLAALASAQGGPEQHVSSPPAAGTWSGTIEVPDAPLDVTVRLEPGEEGWSGTIDIPAQGASGVALVDVSVEGARASFVIDGPPGDPTFDGTVDGGSMRGTFTQGGQEFPFTLERADPGAAAAASAQDARFEDPQGRFTVPVPTGWRVEEREGFVSLLGPAGELRVHVVVSQGADPEAAVPEAWALAAPEFDLEPDETLTPPSEPGVERTVVVNYDPPSDERRYQAFARLHEGTVYTVLIDAELASLQRRASQVQIVANGLEISAVEETDLAGQEPRPVADVLPELRTFVEEQLAAFDVPGLALAIVAGDEVVHLEGFGVVEVGSDTPVTPETHMMIGSTGKTMTSALTAVLVDEEALDWDTPVVEVLPEFAVADPELTERITVRNLLCACTGVPRRDLELFFNADALGAEGVIEQLRTFEFFTDFGEVFQYSNQLVATAGYAAAAADGAAYGELFEGYARSLAARVLAPIGMTDTTLSFDAVRERGRYAQPHQQSMETGDYEPIPLSIEETLLPVAPAGAHWSTAADMARYMATLLNVGVTPDGERIVSEDALRVTWEPQVPVSDTESYGLGWLVGTYKGLDRLHHSGNTLGFTSEFVFLPEADVGVVVLSNGQGTNSLNSLVATRLFELLYDLPSEAVAQAAFAVERSEAGLSETQQELVDAVDPGKVAPFLGAYANDALGEIVLEMENDQLMLDAGEFRTSIRPRLDSDGEFDTYVTFGVPLAGLPVELVEDEEGRPTVKLGRGQVSYAFEPVP